MQKLAEICIRRPVFAAMIVLSLVVVGAASYFKLGVDRFPSVDLPTVTVRTSLPGASAEDLETAAQDVRDRVGAVVGRLPAEVKPPVIQKFNNDSTPALVISLSGERSL